MKLITAILFLISSAVCAQRADFFREDITFTLNEECLDIEGYYWFANNSSDTVNSGIYYPFPASSGTSIDSVRLYSLSHGYKLPYFLDDPGGITFQLSILPEDTVLLQIGYRQKLSKRCAEYILKSTQGWGKPIELAEYKLITPDTLTINSFSYPPDKNYLIEKKKIYYWKKQNFMPEKDMMFCF